jgi:hypothetical protein
MIDTITGVQRIAARLAQFDGAYLRFAGDLEIVRYRGGELVEAHKDDAIWELMYFGHARESGLETKSRVGEESLPGRSSPVRSS